MDDKTKAKALVEKMPSEDVVKLLPVLERFEKCGHDKEKCQKDLSESREDRVLKPVELMKLSLEDRHRILAEATSSAEEVYHSNPDLTDFEAFGDDDLYDYDEETR